MRYPTAFVIALCTAAVACVHNPEPALSIAAAAEQGDPGAQNNLGWMYHKGEGVSQDFAQAAHWFRKAAEQGDPQGQIYLGLQYRFGYGVPQNYNHAVDWFRKAADSQSSYGKYLLGIMYYLGTGVRQDFELAYMFLNLAVVESGEVPPGLAVELRDFIASNYLTPEEQIEAQRLARKWTPIAP